MRTLIKNFLHYANVCKDSNYSPTTQEFCMKITLNTVILSKKQPETWCFRLFFNSKHRVQPCFSGSNTVSRGFFTISYTFFLPFSSVFLCCFKMKP